ncbi:hypothetical protein BKA70DRAFT_1104282 [Coprinopsis sp. MPI-PUGE-AT-0042]|nr:hypothetical protein BKA70DRAFT_1104282 [Coprinopsis sp. MPI-PUGE-AT-0042]
MPSSYTQESTSNARANAPVDLTAHADAQSTSPLFTVFPPEIRAEIFALAVSSFPDTSRPYDFTSYWYRPGHTAPRLTKLSLLATCKRIYTEAKDLVWQQGSGNDEETFWWGFDRRRPPETHHLFPRFLQHPFNSKRRPHPDGPLQSSRQEAFTPSHWSRICRIHIFPQMFTFSSRAFIRTFIQAEGLRPRTVRVTIRYTDWWNWEFNASLDLASIVPEANAYYFPESVDTFIIELESAQHKKNELEGMVKHILDNKRTWKWKRLDDEYLEFDEDAGVKEWDWMGTTMFDGDKFAHHPQGETMEYIVKVLTFTAKPTQVEWDGTPFDRALAIKGYESSLRPN